MNARTQIQKILMQEDLNFLLTNRLPRRWLTQCMGWFSKIEQPWVRDLSIATWRFFSGLDLSEAKKSHFTSMHDCFIRELRAGARAIERDPAIMASPSDAIIGAHGRIEGTQVFQAKGFPYTLEDLIGDEARRNPVWRDGYFVTLRLTASMYHRFHAPLDCAVDQVTYFSGDTWNVNPIALRRVERLFCKNERAFIRTRVTSGPAQGKQIALVPVAAILVASIRLHFADVLLHMNYHGPRRIVCDTTYAKGAEMGWFQHGSTIIVLAPRGFALCEGLREGSIMRMGQALMRWAGRPD
jgi:phosphatidylserine decarboxylase